MQEVMPKGMSRDRVAWAMRPNPRKPTVRFGEMGDVLSWGPQNEKGLQAEEGHWEEGMEVRRELLGEGTGYSPCRLSRWRWYGLRYARPLGRA